MEREDSEPEPKITPAQNRQDAKIPASHQEQQEDSSHGEEGTQSEQPQLMSHQNPHFDDESVSTVDTAELYPTPQEVQDRVINSFQDLPREYRVPLQYLTSRFLTAENLELLRNHDIDGFLDSLQRQRDADVNQQQQEASKQPNEAIQQAKAQWRKDYTVDVVVAQDGKEQEPRTYIAPKRRESHEPEQPIFVTLLGGTLIYKWKDDHRKAQQQKAQEKYRQTHPKAVKEQQQRWRESHKDEINAYQSDYMSQRRAKERQEASEAPADQPNNSPKNKAY